MEQEGGMYPSCKVYPANRWTDSVRQAFARTKAGFLYSITIDYDKGRGRVDAREG